MSVNSKEINIPINSEKRDPFYGRSKSEIGLGLVQNMSFDTIETAILANVKSTVDEGVAYNYESYASDSDPILANIVKLKPNSSRTVLHFSLGTWTKNSEFISRDTATLELRSNRTNVSYNLYVTEPYPNNGFDSTDSSLNRSTPLTSTKVIIREFNTGGWLVSLKVVDRTIDAIWVNLVESKNIDIQNPMSNIYEESEFGRSIEFYCDKSRISTNLDIGGASLVAKALNHPVPIKLKSVDPDDYYNSRSKMYSLSNIDISGQIGTPSLIKDNTIVSIPILTDENTCKSDQLIPLSVNRLNHQIKFRISGNCMSNSQLDSWKKAQTDQRNLSAFLDTDPEAINEYPVSITELTHDINVEIGRGSYYGSVPESGPVGGSGYGRYEFSSGKVNYATIQDSSNGRNEYYEYNLESKSWLPTSNKYMTRDKSVSLSTKSNSFSELNLVIHGLDHDLKLEVANLEYRNSRGIATDSNGLLNSGGKIDSGIRNLTWEEPDGVESETRRNSYATGSVSINTFEKNSYQCLNLNIHGLDHNILLDFYRVRTDVLKGPSSDDVLRSDSYRPNSNGKDILGSIEVDTFTKRIQNFKLEVIDGRYSDCTRGLALKLNDNFMPYDQINDLGDYGDYLPTAPSSDEIESIYPTINGIPFTGDFRYKVKYPSNLEIDGISKEHSVRNVVVPAYHYGSSLEQSGTHDWEVLGNIRVTEYNSNGIPVSVLKSLRYLNDNSSVNKGYGLTRMTTIDSSATGTSQEKIKKYLDSLGDDSDSVSVKALKLIIGATNSSSESVTEDIENIKTSIESAKTELKEYTNSKVSSTETKLTQGMDSVRVELKEYTNSSVKGLESKVNNSIVSSVGSAKTELKEYTNTSIKTSEDNLLKKINDAKGSSLHSGSSLNDAGAHQWEVLSSIRVAGYSSNGSAVSRINKSSYLDSVNEYSNGFGLTRLAVANSSTLEDNINPADKVDNIMNSLTNDEDVISVKVLKYVVRALTERIDKLEKSILIK